MVREAACRLADQFSACSKATDLEGQTLAGMGWLVGHRQASKRSKDQGWEGWLVIVDRGRKLLP